MQASEQQFDGGVFQSGLEGGRSGARVTITGSAVLAETPEGEVFSVPYEGCELSLGGASGKMWFCRSRDRETTIFSEATGFSDALRGAAQRELVERLEALEHAASEARERTFWLVSGVLVLLVFLSLAAVYVVRHAGSLVVRAVPISVDEKIGALAIEHMDLGGPVSKDKVLNDAVHSVFKRLHVAQRTRYRFSLRVVESPQINAFALPGGPIVVYTGLLREAASAEQFAGVLAHEMGHVTRRHGMQRIAQSLGVVSLVQLVFGDVSGVMAVVVELLRVGAINSYSREQEREADLAAIERMRRARLDPDALAAFFRRLLDKDGESPGALAWFGTHPDLSQRIATVHNWTSHHIEQETAPIAIDWAEVQRRAGKDLDQNR